VHERGFERLKEPGRLTLRTLVTLPEGQVKLRIESKRPIVEATFGGDSAQPAAGPKGTATVEFAVEATGEPAELALSVRTGAHELPFGLTAAYQSGDSAAVVLSRERLTVPWAPATPPAPGPGPPLPELTGGDRARGEVIFYGEAARCANCHQVRGKGKTVGPDLTPLAGRARTAVYRDIAEPSASIRPDYVPYTVALKDGRVVVGIVRSEGFDAIRVIDTEAKATLVRLAEIEELRPSATSIMPVGLAGAIGETAMRDLLAFLTGARPPAAAK
jgi:putative heme-binding domain-containing protein